VSDFESILAKARKLAALAAADSGAEEGERATAQRMLEEHLARHDITLEALKQQQMKRRELDVCTLRRTDKPGLHAKLRSLAVNLFWYVVGDSKRAVYYRKGEVYRPTRGAGPDQTFRVWVVLADCIELEFEDWRACFHHFAPAYLDSEEQLRRDIKALQKALQKALKSLLGIFVNKHHILPPDAKQCSKEPTMEEMLAAMIARQAVKGERWERPAGRLEQSDFLLK
jgi:hypothetical protein